MNTRSGNVDFVLGVGGVSFVIGGIALLMLAVVRLESGGGNKPIPVPPDTAVRLPEPGAFGGSQPLGRLELGVLRAGRALWPAALSVAGTSSCSAPTSGHRIRRAVSGDGSRALALLRRRRRRGDGSLSP